MEGRLLEGLTFKVADLSEREQALELRRRVYQRELGHDGIDEFDEYAYHLIAVDLEGKIVGALRLIGPEQRPFDIEQLVMLSDYLSQDRRPGELSRLCVEPDRRRVGREGSIHLGVLKLAHSFARKHQLTDFITLALPHLRNLYRLAYFRPLGPTPTHPTWGPVTVMHLDLIDIEVRYSHSSQRMARFLFGADPPNIVV